MPRNNIEELEVMLKLIRDKYKDLGQALDLVEEGVVLNKTLVSVHSSKTELSKLAKFIDTLDILLEE